MNVYMKHYTRAHISFHKYYTVILLAQGQMLRGLNYFQAENAHSQAYFCLHTHVCVFVHMYMSVTQFPIVPGSVYRASSVERNDK